MCVEGLFYIDLYALVKFEDKTTSVVPLTRVIFLGRACAVI